MGKATHKAPLSEYIVSVPRMLTLGRFRWMEFGSPLTPITTGGWLNVTTLLTLEGTMDATPGSPPINFAASQAYCHSELRTRSLELTTWISVNCSPGCVNLSSELRQLIPNTKFLVFVTAILWWQLGTWGYSELGAQTALPHNLSDS